MAEGAGPAVHPSATELLGFFAYEHLAPELQAISRPFAEVAERLVHELAVKRRSAHPAELTAALRKLVEAKDCAVRAALPAHRPLDAPS